MNRIMIAAAASGSGKTLITCGILQALVNRKMNVASFKCGPDYIDPMFHSRVIGTHSKNLDSFFADDDTLRYIFGRTAEISDISVIEGVMGFFDGLGGTSVAASSYDVSEKLEVPVVLVVNCRGASVSCVPVIKGFLEFRRNNIKGVILNNTNERIFGDLKDMIEEHGIKALGYVPNVKDLVLESRHLGLVMPSEIDDLKEKLNALADILERTVDIGSLVEIANSAPPLGYEIPECRRIDGSVKIGIARDDAFCFVYEDNIELMERCGAEISYFSPIDDSVLPDVSGIILPGGYPELYASKLAANRVMMDGIRKNIMNGMPCIAECGGFMYLHDELEDLNGEFHRMAGVISGKACNRGKLSRFGYVSVFPKHDGILGNGMIKGHEFHYWDSTSAGDGCVASKPSSGAEYECMHCNGNIAAGFPHLYYYSNPDAVYNFLTRCADHREAKSKAPKDLQCRQRND